MSKLWKPLSWLMVVALVIIATGCGPKPWEQYGMSQEDYERLRDELGPDAFPPIVEPDSGKDPPGSNAPGGAHTSLNDPTPVVIIITSAAPPGGAGLGEKPVRFRNLGRLPFTVMPATYALPDGSPGVPGGASTVAFPSSHGALRLPLGTYTWCYYWELGDTNGDGITDYAHAIYPYPLELNANSSDDEDLAVSVDLAAPAGSGERPGACAPAGLPAAQLSTPLPGQTNPTPQIEEPQEPGEPVQSGSMGQVTQEMTAEGLYTYFEVHAEEYKNTTITKNFVKLHIAKGSSTVSGEGTFAYTDSSGYWESHVFTYTGTVTEAGNLFEGSVKVGGANANGSMGEEEWSWKAERSGNTIVGGILIPDSNAFMPLWEFRVEVKSTAP